MKLPKAIIILALLTLSGYFFYQTYLVLVELGNKQSIQREVNEYAAAERYEYLQIMLKEKEILSNNSEFVEKEARMRLDYSMPGEIVVYFPDKPKEAVSTTITDSNSEISLSEFINTWLFVLYPF